METGVVLAEVVASTTGTFTAEVRRDVDEPALGEWVQVEGRDGIQALGIVAAVDRGSVAPNRQAVALGKDRETLRREMPHVLELLRTTIEVYVLAHVEAGGRLRQSLPPRPPDIHDFVRRVPVERLAEVVAPFDVLRILVARMDEAEAGEDLVAAVLRQLVRARETPADAHGTLVRAGRELSRLYRDDHERLQAILRRV
jgi:hypothetical protein